MADRAGARGVPGRLREGAPRVGAGHGRGRPPGRPAVGSLAAEQLHHAPGGGLVPGRRERQR
ncbi:hypothetical protein ACFVZD_02250, partial [Streptomyces sp. NPDC058287]|uniref:hypothetical protein n=1 Tax=Streptomyces sp. NPDC058287 TaxID=3346423 RepID=UPI0036E1BC33